MTPWHSVPLGKVVTFQRGYDLPHRIRKQGTVPIVSSAGVTDYHNVPMVNPPGVVTGRYGTIGEIFLITEPFWPLNTTLYVRDFHGNDPCFVYHLLHRFDFRSFSGKSGVPGVNRNDLHLEPVALPEDVGEQRAIAAALSDVDALLDGLKRLIAKKRDLKQATMQQLLTGQTRLPGFRGEWEVKRLGEIAALNRVNVVPALQPNNPFMHFSLPAFDAGRNAEIDLGSSIGSNKFGVPRTAVLVSKLNPRIPRIWAPRSVPENAVASTEWLVLTPRDGIDRQYLFTLCSSPVFCEQMELAATGTTGSHQRINPSTALDIRIDVTIDPGEQIAIATVLSDLDAELSALEARRDKTRALKQGMMQELLTGKTRLVAASSNVVPVDFATKPKPAPLQRSATKHHNWQFNEAVVVAVLVKRFGSEKYPLGRKRCTKLAYLLHRHVEHVAEGYLKKAAGPYNPAVKYQGPEGIAQKNGYIRAHKNGNYSGFIAADNTGQAEDYFDKWYGPEVLDWLEQFRKKTNDELELLATVDMAAGDVKRVNAKVSVAAVKSVIRDHPEWEAKLEREIFSDANIARAIRRVSELFSTE